MNLTSIFKKNLTLFLPDELNFLPHNFPSYFPDMDVCLFQFKYLQTRGTKVETQKVQKAYILELIPIPFALFASPHATKCF